MFIVIITLFFLSILVCIYDWKYRVVPNYICVIIFLIAILMLVLNDEFSNLWRFALAIPLTLIIWRIGILGAGDCKLLLAFFPMIATQYYVATVVFIGLTGFATVLVFLLFRRVSRNNNYNTVPYGIPIALSCFVTSIASF